MPEAKVHPKLQQAADDLIAEQLPAWLKNTSPQQLKSLRACMSAHLQSQKRMAATSRQLLALDRFAAQRLEQAMILDALPASQVPTGIRAGFR